MSRVTVNHYQPKLLLGSMLMLKSDWICVCGLHLHHTIVMNRSNQIAEFTEALRSCAIPIWKISNIWYRQEKGLELALFLWYKNFSSFSILWILNLGFNLTGGNNQGKGWGWLQGGEGDSACPTLEVFVALSHLNILFLMWHMFLLKDSL